MNVECQLVLHKNGGIYILQGRRGDELHLYHPGEIIHFTAAKEDDLTEVVSRCPLCHHTWTPKIEGKGQNRSVYIQCPGCRQKYYSEWDSDHYLSRFTLKKTLEFHSDPEATP